MALFVLFAGAARTIVVAADFLAGQARERSVPVRSRPRGASLVELALFALLEFALKTVDGGGRRLGAVGLGCRLGLKRR